MSEQILFYIHAGIVLIFGISLSVIFSGIRMTKKTILSIIVFSLFCGLLQMGIAVFFSTQTVEKMYPLIAHLPMFVFLTLIYRKKMATALVAICTAYMCCQPSKWLSLLALQYTQNTFFEYTVKCLSLLALFPLIYFLFSGYMAVILNRSTRNVFIFGITPIVYYVFDYATTIYTNFWAEYTHIVAEFTTTFLCFAFLIFCVVYHREYEQKSDAKRREQIIRITADSQKKEAEIIEQNMQEMRLLRHDMRLFLNTLSASLDNNDIPTAKNIIASYVDGIDATVTKKYCSQSTLNYLFSSFDRRCQKLHIHFDYSIMIEHINCDEILLASVLSNALDNAVCAQEQLPENKRQIRLMIKMHHEKLLISIQNPFKEKPIFVNDMPISEKIGHGYGTQSIVYLTERMGGHCQFYLQNNLFVLRIII